MHAPLLASSHDELGAHEFVKLDLSSLNSINHDLSLRVVLILVLGTPRVILRNDVGLILLKSRDRLPQVTVLLFERLDPIEDVSFGLVGDEGFLETVSDRTIVQLLQ